MNYFLDTNMPIGYTVVHDKFHETAKKFINEHENSLFWSNLVKKEYNETFTDISDEIGHFLDSVENILEKNEKDFDYYLKFEKFIITNTKHVKLDSYKKHKIIEDFWNINYFNSCSCDEIYRKFVKFNQKFNDTYFKRDKNINNIMKLHNCGIDNYLKYLNYTSKLKSWGMHSPDYKIIVDAHDCGIKHGELTFVSADGKIFESLIGNDTSFLKIVEFESCKT